MSCPECAGYVITANHVCPACEEPTEETMTAYETGYATARQGDIYALNPYEDEHDREEWACGFYEYFYDTLKETAADIIDHLRDLKRLNP
jgi:hypothetical protein